MTKLSLYSSAYITMISCGKIKDFHLAETTKFELYHWAPLDNIQSLPYLILLLNFSDTPRGV